jgi:DNA polymerase III sliding clamp (beta) subunit (PCNA family)
VETAKTDNRNADEDVDCTLEGKPIDLGMNGKYALAILEACQGERVSFYSKDTGAPMRIVSDDDDMAVMVLMPMRV